MKQIITALLAAFLALWVASAHAANEVTLRTAVRCDDCGGSGAGAGTQPVTCSECNGAGQVRKVLFEDHIKNGMMEGYTDNYIRITTPYRKEWANQIVEWTIA